jgi:hypothetical protein
MGSLARKLASLIDSSGDIRVGNLDNAVVGLLVCSANNLQQLTKDTT